MQQIISNFCDFLLTSKPSEIFKVTVTQIFRKATVAKKQGAVTSFAVACNFKGLTITCSSN